MVLSLVMKFLIRKKVLEVLVFYPSLVCSFLSNERYFHRAFKILFDFSQFFHRIIKYVVSVDIEVEKDESIKVKLMVKVNF